MKALYDKFSHRGRFLVYSHENRNPVPVISRHFLITIATQIHDNYNHIGRAKLLVLLQKFCWSPAMSFLISNITKTCPLCQANKADTGKLAPPLLRRQVLSPYDLVCIDILSLNRTPRGNTCMLVLADHCSKWLQCVPLKNHTSATLISAIKQYITSSIRCPRAILSDNEPSLVSAEFKAFCDSYDIDRVYSAPHQPHCNGFSEKNCGLVSKQLRFFAEANQDWDLLIQRVVIDHNFSINSTTNLTPSSFILEKAHTIDTDNILPSELESKWRMGNPNFCPYEIGQKVLIKIKYIGNRTIDKLKARFQGIFKVTKVNGSGLTYDLCHINDENYTKLNIHYSDLKTYHFPVSELRSNRIFIEHYMRWREMAFGEEDKTENMNNLVEQDEVFEVDILGLPGKITTHPGALPGGSTVRPAECLVRPPGYQLSDGGESSSLEEDIRVWEIEEALAHEKELEYKQYEEAWECWQAKFNNQLINIQKIPYELFRVNYIDKILEFDKNFRREPIYFFPKPDGSLPNLGPSDVECH